MKIRRVQLLALTAVCAGALVVQASSNGGALKRGEIAVAHRAGGLETRTDARPPRVLRSHTSHTSGEPTIGVSKKGNVFLAAVQNGPGVDVLRSKDAGHSWDNTSPRLGGQNVHQISLDPYVYLDEGTQRLFTIDLTVACSYLSFSDDFGASWITNPLACGRPVNDHQTLFAGPPATSEPVPYDNVVYYCWNDVASSSCSRSLDGGLTFHPTGEPAFVGFDTEGQSGELCGGLHGHGLVDRKGTVYLPREYCRSPYLAISRDEGASWERVVVSSLKAVAGGDPSVATDDAGNLYYAWIGPQRLPYLVVSKDGGKSWSRPMMIAAPGVDRVNLVTLDAGGRGKVAFAYMGTKDAKHPMTWDGYMGMSANVLDRKPLFFSGAINSPDDPLKIGACGPGRCGETVLDFIDVEIAPDGSAWAPFVDACTGACAKEWLERGNEGLVGHLVGGPSLR